MQITFSVYFTNHLNKKIKIDNKIVSVEDGILELDNCKLYTTLTFVTNDVFIDSSIVGDLQERVEIKYKIDDGEIVGEYFVIDSIEYLLNNNIKLYCKSKTVEYTYKYSGNQNKIISTSSLKDLLNKLMPATTINYENLTDMPFIFDYEIKNKSIEEVISELHKITLFDYYFYKGVLYFEDKKSIKENDESIKKFTSINDIVEFNTTTNKDDKKTNKILINDTEDDVISAEPIIMLELKDSPQCCSPDSVIVFEDDNNTYKISPVNAFYIVYFSPTIKLPEINMEVESGERVVIEKYTLEKDYYVKLAGGIDELIAIDGVQNYTFETGYNLLVFDKVDKGELKITYKTTVLHGTIEHNKYPKDLNINIKHFNQTLDYTHKTELKGYYPIPYDFTLNLVSNWGIDYAEAIGGDVTIARKIDDSFDFIETKSVNQFGEMEFSISIYGTYRFTRSGQDDLYLDWFINSNKIYMNEVL